MYFLYLKGKTFCNSYQWLLSSYNGVFSKLKLSLCIGFTSKPNCFSPDNIKNQYPLWACLRLPPMKSYKFQ